jgi:urease accessory protein
LFIGFYFNYILSYFITIVNKTDLAPYVGVDLESMESDVALNRKNKPFVFVSNKDKKSLTQILEWIQA